MIHQNLVETDSGLIARITFVLPNSVWADKIFLVGDFNDWNRTSHPLHRNRDGEWWLTIDLKTGRSYEFRYLCDGSRWMNDPQADAYRTNPWGSENFIVVIALPDEDGLELRSES